MKRLIPLIIALLLQSSVFGQISLPEPTKIVAWWPFCNDYSDHSNNGFNLTNFGAFLNLDRFGNEFKSADFTGTASGLAFTPFFPTLSDCSYACWIYPRGPQNGIIWYNGDPDLNGFGIVMNDGAVPAGAGTQVGVRFGGIGQFINTTVTPFAWHHVALTRSGNTFRLYIDSAFIGFSVQTGVVAPTGSFNIGMDIADADEGFNGQVDDMIIYEPTILTLPQIREVARFNSNMDSVLFVNDSVMSCNDSVLLSSTTSYPAPTGSMYDYKYRWGINGPAIIYGTTPTIKVPRPEATDPTVSYILFVDRLFACSSFDTQLVWRHEYNIKLPNDTMFCVKDTVTVQASGTPTVLYTWSGTDNTTYDWSAIGDTSRVKIWTTGRYYVTGDSLGCFSRDSINIKVSDTPNVRLGPDIAQCEGLPVTLTDTATYIGPEYLWSNGSVTNTTTATVTGNYWLRVTDSGCAYTDTIHVLIAHDTFTLHTLDQAICVGDEIVARVTGHPGIHFQWTPTTGILFPEDTSLTPRIKPDTSAWYVVTANIGDCFSSDSFYLDVQPYPAINMGNNRHVCVGDSIRIGPTITPAWYTNYIYDWSNGTYLDDSTAAVVKFTAGADSRLYLVVTTPAGCKDNDSVDVFVHTNDFVAMDTTVTICPNDSVQFTPNEFLASEAPVTYRWRYGPDFTDSTAAAPWLHVRSSQMYYGIATSKWGCRDTVTADVSVYPNAVFYMDDSTVLYPGNSFAIKSQTNASTFHWFPGLGLSDTTISNPVASPTISTRYVVEAITEFGCRVVDSIKIRVDAGTLIDMPNAFAPGGVNNSKLYVIKRGLVGLNYFRVYDRWGNMLFETKDIDAGWDGMYNDKPQPFGVYVYDIEAINERGRVLRKQGNVTLIR